MLIILCGPSFSGKSTLANRLQAQHGFHVISLDAINERRGLWGGEGIPQEEWAKTHKIAQKELEDLLTKNKPAVLDDTNCFKFLRDNYRNIGQKHGMQVSLWLIKPTIETLCHRRAKNDKNEERRGIAEDVFTQHLESFEWPLSDEPHILIQDLSIVDIHELLNTSFKKG